MKAHRLASVLLAVVACGPKDVSDSPVGVIQDPLVTSTIPGIYQNYYRIACTRPFSGTDSASMDIDSDNWAQAYVPFHGGANQQFLIVPAAPDTNYFYVVPKHKGGVLDVKLDSNDWLYMYDGYPTGAANQLFWLSPVVGDATHYYLRPVHSSKYVSSTLTLFRMDARSATTGYKFKFEPVAALPYAMPVLRAGVDPGAIGDVPRIMSYSATPPQDSPPQLIGETLIPFLYVHEQGRAWQAQQSPYYRLAREQFWRRTAVSEKPAGFASTVTWKMTVGMSHETSVKIETTLGTTIKVNGDFAFTKDWLKATLGASLQKDMKVVTTLEETTKYSENTELSRSTTLPTEKRVRWTAWYLVDRYTLYRMDGSQVDSPWELVYQDPMREIIDAYSE